MSGSGPETWLVPVSFRGTASCTRNRVAPYPDGGVAVTRRFNGFLVQTEPAVGIPRAFFTDVLPQISELSEAQATLAVFRLASEGWHRVARLGDRSSRRSCAADRIARQWQPT